MNKRRIILLLLGSILSIVGTSLGQEIETFLDNSYSGENIETTTENIGSGILISGENIVLIEELSKEDTSGTIVSDEYTSSGISKELSIPNLSGSSILEEPYYQQPHLIISEVYYDGTDEWIEITNIGNQAFFGNFSLSGAKSTLITLTNVLIMPGVSKVFGDIINAALDSGCIQSSGLGLNILDTSAIRISLIISGQIQDFFGVDSYRVNKYNDKKTSFERLGTLITWVSSERISNNKSGYTVNPGFYFATGIAQDVSIPPLLSGQLLLPLDCDQVVNDSPISINEVFWGNSSYSGYLELAVSGSWTGIYLSISGNILSGSGEFGGDSSGITLEKEKLYLISSTDFWKKEGIDTFQIDNFFLLSTGNWIILFSGSGQSGQVLDIVYISGIKLGKSSYFGNSYYQCARIFDQYDYFSPGFEKKFLKYLPVQTITKIEYVTVYTGITTNTQSCQTTGGSSILSGISLDPTNNHSVFDLYTINIVDVDYDPPGADTNNEKITLYATHISGDSNPLDMSKGFRIYINGKNKTLSGLLPMNTPTTFTKTFGFPNSSTSGEDIVVKLIFGDYVFATYTYNPKKLSSLEQKELTNTTGYYVSSVLDGDTFRIKYQGKTQSIRLLGVDAPESTKTRYRHIECFGTQAKEYLKTLIDKKRITLEFDPSQEQKDFYDRLLAYVYLDGIFVNQKMIEDGYAKEYTYKTPYHYQNDFIQAQYQAQEQQRGLWNSKTCGISFSGDYLSGILFSGDQEFSGISLDLSGLLFTITYVLPNPKGKDIYEELGLLISTSTGSSISDIDLSQGFRLHVGKTKKKLSGIVKIGQETVLSGTLGLVNKAACVSLVYQEQELTKFCYRKPKEGEKIFASDQGLAETSQEHIDILNTLQLKTIGKQLCIWYQGTSILCKKIPAGKAARKTIYEQRLYKSFSSLIKQYMIDHRKPLYYDTPLKSYFDLLKKNKNLIARGIVKIDIYGQSVDVTNIKKQVKILSSTPKLLAMLYEGKQAMMNK